jgi:hypothetical protein
MANTVNTQAVNLAARFRLAPDEELEEWLTRITAAYPEQAEDVSPTAPAIGPDWDPRKVDEETNVDLLVQAAAEDSIIIRPGGMELNFVYDGNSYWFAVDIGLGMADYVSLATWGYEVRKLVGDGIVGAAAAESILAEAVGAANGALTRLQQLIADCTSD